MNLVKKRTWYGKVKKSHYWQSKKTGIRYHTGAYSKIHPHGKEGYVGRGWTSRTDDKYRKSGKPSWWT